MSLSLKKVELSNVRLHKSLVFEPASDGITALCGPTGAGKSTILDSIAWVLYGTKPKNVKRAIYLMRRGTDLSKEKCFGRIELVVDGVDILVERRIVSKSGNVECEIWEKKDDAKDWGKSLAGPAVSQAEPYIRKRLGMDELGFLAAVLVQQKEVDQLINAKTPERALVIENLTGISSITAALVEARQNLTQLKKDLKNTDLDSDQLPKLEKELEKSQKESEELKTSMEQMQEKSVSIGTEIDELQKLITEVETIETQNENKRVRLASIEATLAQLEVQLKETLAEKETAKSKLTSGNVGSLEDLTKNVNEKREQVRSHERELGRFAADKETIQKSLEEYNHIMSVSNIKDLETANETFSKASDKLNKMETAREALQNKIAGEKSEIRKIANAIEVISAHDGHCPTCLQDVAEPQVAIDALNAERSRHEDSIEQNNEQMNKADTAIASAKDSLSRLNKLIESFTQAESLQKNLSELDEKIAGHKGEVKVLESEISSLDKLVQAARYDAELRENYNNLHNKAVGISDSQEKLQAEKNSLQAESDAKRPTRKTLITLRNEHQTAVNKRDTLLSQFRDKREKYVVLNTTIKYTVEKIETAKKEVERYEELRTSVEVSASSVSILEEFRENRIKTSIPVLEQYASQFLSRFTDGSYTRLKLDNKFNATVYMANGTESPVGLLSGGELSAAGLALRLAISMLLNDDSSKNLILLDEVLVSQDENRAEQILTTIKDTCRGQIIMISHMGNTSEIADKVVQL